MAYNEISEDLHLNPNSWTAAIMFSSLIGILSIGISFVVEIIVFGELSLLKTLMSGIIFTIVLTLIVRATVVLRNQKKLTKTGKSKL